MLKITAQEMPIFTPKLVCNVKILNSYNRDSQTKNWPQEGLKVYHKINTENI